METISLKMDETLLMEIDSTLKRHRYSTRTEFIRDAIRARLSTLEKEETIRKLAALKGVLKGKGKMTDEEARVAAFQQAVRRHGIKLE
jgi:metal-responsive CopG/Arc/MetJ family transcriptional regulator